MTRSAGTRTRIRALIVLVVVAAVAAGILFVRRRDAGLPSPGSEAYDRTVRSFYRGLAALQVGLIDQAKEELTATTVAAPGEPAGWANLALAHLRIGEFEEAAPAADRAVALAPESSEVVFLRARLEADAGQRDAAVADLRRAIELDGRNLLARTALAQALEEAGGPGADDEAQRVLEELLAIEPDNPAVLVERGRLAARRGDVATLRDSIARLAPLASAWPPEVVDQFREVQDAADRGDTTAATRAVAFLRNVLARVPAYAEARARVTPSAELVADPLTQFLKLPSPDPRPSPPDEQLTFVAGEPSLAAEGGDWSAVTAFSPDGDARPIVVAADGREWRVLDEDAAPLPFPGGVQAVAPGANGLVALDWNADFRMDVVAAGPGGVRLFLQGDDGRFTDATREAAARDDVSAVAARGAWAADVEMDGDLDIVVGAENAAAFVLRNNGDGTWTRTEPFPGLTGLQAFAWADVDADGDPDAVTVDGAGSVVVFDNQQAGQFQSLPALPSTARVVSVAAADVDGDGRLEVVTLDAAGSIRHAALDAGVWSGDTLAEWPEAATALASGGGRVTLADLDNNGALDLIASSQAGSAVWLAGVDHAFARLGSAIDADVRVVADLTGDGRLEVVTLDAAGVIRRAAFDAGVWSSGTLAEWPEAATALASGGGRVTLADLDNNGALDLVASSQTGSAVWLAGVDHAFARLGSAIDADVRVVADLTGDGRLDLAGLSGGRVVRLVGGGSRPYHYQVVRPRAQTAAGDQRINSFGIGGRIDVRAGSLVQTQVITGPVVHLGLGDRTVADVTRIVWPNGVPQAEFDPPVDGAIVAAQRLKGSCPWVFADDGTGMRFVTDFLWRSPLGLRINAQDTAGTTQTEDWVRIRGDQLAARDGAYDVRITAELWETHFIDYVALLVVDHPDDVDVFVDERFSREAPALAVRPLRRVRPTARAWDQTGRDVSDVVGARDGRYLDTFARGRYQGVAEDHFVEIDLGAPAGSRGTEWLVAQGWIYPTDSSINVAIGQGHRVQPRGLSLEAQAPDGRWVVVAPDLGFPAGKNKTVLVDLRQVARAGLTGARRVRLRTNLEIYWDALAVAEDASSAAIGTTRLAPAAAELRFRGFSQTRDVRSSSPEVPDYGRIANTAPRWRDLAGYYTRFGDVRELLTAVEDRYVIMNAGDELRLSFPERAAPAAGRARDFVLIGDGWEKDGDFNTTYSKTVLPLPSHGSPEYAAASARLVLEQDPVYRRYPEDWQTYHTRYVTPRPFLEGLR